MLARGYARCSTTEQADSGLGLDAQRAAIASHARRLGAELVSVHEDAGLSGSLGIEDRPGLLAAVESLRRGEILIVAKRDRLARDPLIAAMVERLAARRGARLISAAGEGTTDDDPMSVLTRRMIDVFAEFERLVCRSRTRAALRAKRARGERAGAVPFGFKLGADGRSLEPVATEQAVLGLIRRRHAGGLSLRQIAAELNKKKIPARKGGAWRHSSVISVLKTIERHAA